MLANFDNKFSGSAKAMKRSAIREILKLIQKPGMISFAGGLPSPESFPVKEIKEITSFILENQGAEALQYGTTEGDSLLREMIIKRHREQGLDISPENLAISTGSQQALDLLGKIFLDPGDYVICGLPSYLGGIMAFNIYGAELKGIPFDEKGMHPGMLEEAITQITALGKKIKFIYLIPDFQNPSGITMPESRRTEILEIADRFDIIIIEDSPYREIRFEGKSQKLLYELDSSGRVITLFTFSKILAPGMRLGWMIGHHDIIDKFIMAKQSADVCSPVLPQKIVAEYIRRGLLDKNLGKTVEMYRRRKDIMLECFSRYMPEGVSWTKPEGGLFLFVTLPKNLNADEVFNKAIENNVAFVKGSLFFCNDTGKNTMRINFSYSGEDLINEGIKRLAMVITEMLREAPAP